MNKFFKDVGKENIILEQIIRTSFSLKNIKEKNYYFDFFLETELDLILNVNIIYLAVKFDVVDNIRLKDNFKINKMKNIDEFLTALNKEIKKYLLQKIY